MKTTVQKWGNSLAVRIPSAFARELNIENRDHLNIALEGGKIVLVPHPVKKADIKTLLAGITRSNLHVAEEWGAPVGSEVW